MQGEAQLPGRPAYLRFLPDFLFHADANKARYVAKAWLLVLLPAIALSALVTWLAPTAPAPDIPLRGPMLPVMILLLVAIGPLIETLLMMPVLLIVDRFAGPGGPAVIANAALWGVLHSLQAPTWGLVVWWPFLVMSIAFLTWRPHGLVTAILLVTAIHGLQNSVSAAILVVADARGSVPAA
jgi:hypothetical protein